MKEYPSHVGLSMSPLRLALLAHNKGEAHNGSIVFANARSASSLEGETSTWRVASAGTLVFRAPRAEGLQASLRADPIPFQNIAEIPKQRPLCNTVLSSSSFKDIGFRVRIPSQEVKFAEETINFYDKQNYLLHILQNVLINAVGDSSSRVVIVVVSPAKCHINLETLKTPEKKKQTIFIFSSKTSSNDMRNVSVSLAIFALDYLNLLIAIHSLIGSTYARLYDEAIQYFSFGMNYFKTLKNMRCLKVQMRRGLQQSFVTVSKIATSYGENKDKQGDEILYYEIENNLQRCLFVKKLPQPLLSMCFERRQTLLIRTATSRVLRSVINRKEQYEQHTFIKELIRFDKSSFLCIFKSAQKCILARPMALVFCVKYQFPRLNNINVTEEFCQIGQFPDVNVPQNLAALSIWINFFIIAKITFHNYSSLLDPKYASNRTRLDAVIDKFKLTAAVLCTISTSLAPIQTSNRNLQSFQVEQKGRFFTYRSDHNYSNIRQTNSTFDGRV
uniref:Uncharacterized protein n=1 Tax=Glossina pallidipes TaxID=7398 RepID=A0A1B0AC83_GLOPL